MQTQGTNSPKLDSGIRDLTNIFNANNTFLKGKELSLLISHEFMANIDYNSKTFRANQPQHFVPKMDRIRTYLDCREYNKKLSDTICKETVYIYKPMTLQI